MNGMGHRRTSQGMEVFTKGMGRPTIKAKVPGGEQSSVQMKNGGSKLCARRERERMKLEHFMMECKM